MNNSINDVKIPTPAPATGRDQKTVQSRSTETEDAGLSNGPDQPSSGTAAAQKTAPESNAIQSREAAETALDRFKDLITSRPSEALAAYGKVTGHSVDNLLGSAVSASS